MYGRKRLKDIWAKTNKQREKKTIHSIVSISLLLSALICKAKNFHQIILAKTLNNQRKLLRT